MLGLLLLSCQTLTAQDYGAPPGQIVVAVLHFSHAHEGYSITLTGASLIDSYKPLFQDEYGPDAKGDVICQILDQYLAILDSLEIKQPLQIRYEYPADDQTIGSARIPVQENSVIVRFRHIPSMKYLRLLTLDATRQPESSTTLTLPEMRH